MNPVIRCPKNKNGKHQWHKKEKQLTGTGHTVMGFVCACGAVDYCDLT